MTFATSAWVKTQFDNFATRISLIFAKKTEVPTKTSDLTNDEGFITNAAADLVNYYTKSQTYNKEEVSELIAAVGTMTFKRVDELPTEDISTNTIYLVPKAGSRAKNVFTEYIYVDGNWETIGETDTNLQGYVTTEQLETLLADYVAKSDAETENIDFSTYFATE